MYANNCTNWQLKQAAINCGFDITIENRFPKGWMFTIKHPTGDDFYRKMSTQLEGKKRRCGGVCLHGHYHYFRELFLHAPDAEILSSWYGKIIHTEDTLEDNYIQMMEMVIRKYDQLTLDNECNCTEDMKWNFLRNGVRDLAYYAEDGFPNSD
jgi:hypothetical protein